MQVTLTFFTQAVGWHKPLPAADSAQTLILIFAEPDIQPYQTALAELQQHYPLATFAGCSTLAGVFNHALMQHALVVGIIRFHNTQLAIAFAEIDGAPTSYQAGLSLAKQLNRPDLRGVLLLSDGLHTHGTELIRGITAHVDQQRVTIAGGLASDQLQFNATWVLHNGQACSHLACAIGFYGDKLVFATQAKDGFKPFGPERRITRAEGQILYEIDHRPALELYREYLGDYANDCTLAAMLRFPLAIWKEQRQTYVVRTPIAINPADSSLVFVGDIPNGYQTQLLYGSFDHLVEGAETVARNLANQLPTDQPVLALAISCVGRKNVLHEDTTEELEATLDNLPQGSQQLGFYSYGEIAPTAQGSGRCGLHNETMTLTVLYERS